MPACLLSLPPTPQHSPTQTGAEEGEEHPCEATCVGTADLHEDGSQLQEVMSVPQRRHVLQYAVANQFKDIFRE